VLLTKSSFGLGEAEFKIAGIGNVRALLGYGGLTYAFICAQDIEIKSLKEYPQDGRLEIGTHLWLSAREEILLPGYLGPERIGEMRPVDLITIWEPLDDVKGPRVANFYAPRICGRTPSGTGLSARVAIETAAGGWMKGKTMCTKACLGCVSWPKWFLKM
jgi:proline racemase